MFNLQLPKFIVETIPQNRNKWALIFTFLLRSRSSYVMISIEGSSDPLSHASTVRQKSLCGSLFHYSDKDPSVCEQYCHLSLASRFTWTVNEIGIETLIQWNHQQKYKNRIDGVDSEWLVIVIHSFQKHIEKISQRKLLSSNLWLQCNTKFIILIM